MNQFYYQSIHYLSKNYLAVTLLFNWPMSRKFRHTRTYFGWSVHQDIAKKSYRFVFFENLKFTLIQLECRPSSFSFAISPWINCTMYLFDCFITKVNFKGIWKGYAFKVDLCYKKSTRRMQIQVHSTLRTTYDWQTKKQTTEQHTLVQPPIQQKRQHQYRTQFLALVDKHVPKDHKLRKIFNRNTIKISYSCMNNTKQIIDNHNKRILNSSKHINDTADNTNTKDSKTCNCRQKNTCPLNGNCLQSSLIYQAAVTRKDNNTTETYIRLTENDFKTRYTSAEILDKMAAALAHFVYNGVQII